MFSYILASETGASSPEGALPGLCCPHRQGTLHGGHSSWAGLNFCGTASLFLSGCCLLFCHHFLVFFLLIASWRHKSHSISFLVYESMVFTAITEQFNHHLYQC